MTHDPGGKGRIKLDPSIVSTAEFHGDDNQYRHLLTRDLTDGSASPETWGLVGPPYLAVVGMNPSTADAFVNDQSLASVTRLAEEAGYTRFVMLNTSPLRLTDSKLLGRSPYPLQTPENVFAVLRYAVRAAQVVMACGAMTGSPLLPFAKDLVNDLRVFVGPLWCWGVNTDGWGRHPLYLARTTPLEPWVWRDAATMPRGRFFAPDQTQVTARVGDIFAYRNFRAKTLRDLRLERVTATWPSGGVRDLEPCTWDLPYYKAEVNEWVKRTVNGDTPA